MQGRRCNLHEDMARNLHERACDLPVMCPVPLQVDPAQQRHARWTQCSYSGRPLAEPIVADEGGALYNKADIVQGLAARAAGGQAWPEGLGHIQRLRDLLAVRPQANPSFGRCEASIVQTATSQSPLCCRRILLERRHLSAALRGFAFDLLSPCPPCCLPVHALSCQCFIVVQGRGGQQGLGSATGG
jgi:Rtf2 RING-finger